LKQLMEVAGARTFALSQFSTQTRGHLEYLICTWRKAFAIALVGRAAEANGFLKTARAKIGALEEAARTSKDQLQSLQNENDTLTTAKETSKRELDNARANIGKLEEAANNSNEQLKVPQSEIIRLETVKKTTDREIRDLRANLATINNGAKEKKTKLQSLQTTFNTLDSEHGADKQGLAEARATIDSLNRAAEDAAGELQSLQTQLNDLDDEYGIDKHELAEARAYIRELENDVMGYDTDLSRSKAFGATVARQEYNMMIALHAAIRGSPEPTGRFSGQP
jgi:chromosome segregation ATPase